jgi:ParB family chromosome partitioning protein
MPTTALRKKSLNERNIPKQDHEVPKVAHKAGLGRGLDALLPDSMSGGLREENTQHGKSPERGNVSSRDTGSANIQKTPNAVVQIPIARLVANPGQPRKNFDEAELRELADSIAEHGIIQPIIVADAGNGGGATQGGNYIIIAGERRTRAAKLAGLKEVPAIIRKYTDQRRLEVSLVENIQRSDLNPIEEAAAYKNLMDFSQLSQEELAAKVGKNRSTVTNALRLLKLPAHIQKSLESGGISSGHARALLAVNDKNLREKLFNEITGKGLSVREAEKRASALNITPEEQKAEKTPPPKRPPEITEMEEKFIEKLGTKVTIEGGLEKGRIHIEYYSMEDLDRLYEILGGKG